MKKILLTTITALATCMAHSQWINQNLPPAAYDSYINDIEVVNSSVVWGNPQDGSGASQYTNAFIRTIDGGATWTRGTITGAPAGDLIANIWPIDASTCYVSMYNATSAANAGIFKTTDGGATWNEVGTNMFTTGTSFPDMVYFWDAQNGMAMGDPSGSPLKYEIYLTSDAGATWTQVPSANIPALTDPAEYGITNLFSNADGHVWFGTTYGDVYHSADGGNNWTKAATGLPAYTTTNGRQDISDIAFTDSLHGLALQLDGAANPLVQTVDGGLTWNMIFPSGPFYVSDIEGVPGSDIFVSAGSTTLSTIPYFGTSYSTDNGNTWMSIDSVSSHTSLDFADINTGFGGEFILAGGPVGGAWKWNGLPTTVSCGSSSANAGITNVNSHIICFGDTLVLTTDNVVSPTDGAHGFAIVIANCDISGNNDPLTAACGIPGGFPLIYGDNTVHNYLVNDGTFPAQVYYFTPVVTGNAFGGGPNITYYTLDPSCTNTGTSVMVDFRAQGDPNCTTGITEQATDNFYGIKSIFPVPAKDKLNVTLNSKEKGTVMVSVTDFLGKEVSANQFTTVAGENNLVIDIANQSAGVYFLTVTGNESTVVSKFVKE